MEESLLYDLFVVIDIKMWYIVNDNNYGEEYNNEFCSDIN